MNSVHQIHSKLAEKLPLFVIALFILQPLMDVLSFWMAELQMSNVLTLVLRLLVLAVTVLVGFCLSRRKRIYFVAAAVLVAIGIGHMIACWQFEYQNMITDLSNYVRVIQMPLMVICLITFMKENGHCYSAMKTGIAVNLLIIFAVQILAIITKTEPHTYFDGTGYIGWFSNTNSQSSILSMAAPVGVVWVYQKKGLKSIWFWLVLVGSCLSMFYFGTRLSYGAILALCFGLMCSMIIVKIKDWKKAMALFAVGAVFVGMLPFSPMVKHRQIHADAMAEREWWIKADLDNPSPVPSGSEAPSASAAPGASDNPGTSEPPVVTDPPKVENITEGWEELVLTEEQKAEIERLAPIYKHYVSDFVEAFGLERTIVMFDFTTDITQMTANRTKKLMFAQAMMEHSPVISRFFGVELARFTVGSHIYDVENDFHGIYYLYGAVGLAALLLFIAYFLFLVVKALIKNFRRYFTLEAAGWGIALVMGLAHCYFTAGVLRRPSAAFYLAAVLAGVYYLVKMKKYPDEVEV